MHLRQVRVLAALLALALVAACSPATGSGDAGDPPIVVTDRPAEVTEAPALPTFDLDKIFADILAEDTQFEQEVTVAAPAVFVSNIVPGQPDTEATQTYIVTVIGHLDTVWTRWFLANGFPEPWVGYQIVMPGFSFSSNCVDPITKVAPHIIDSAHPNAYYCPVDTNSSDRGMMILPVETMSKMWAGDIFGRHADASHVGDFAAAMMVAHEFGHHIQDELSEVSGVAAPAPPNTELIADCFAGVWAHSVFLDGYLEDGDLEEALAAYAAIADPVTPGTHGTITQRQNAYQVGYYGSQANPVPGLPGNCLTGYWPEVLATQ